MKKRIVVLLLAGMLTVSGFTAGCSQRNTEKAQEYKELGIKQLSDESYQEAADSFQKALDQSLGKVGALELDVCYYKALAQFKAGDIEGALETYDGLMKYDKKNWEVYYLRGSVYLQDGQTEKCLEDYNQAVELNGEDLELYARIYESLAAAGQQDAGQTYLKQAMGQTASSAEDYANMGYLYFLQEDYENAQKNLLEAVDEGNDEALLRLGQVYAADGKADEAKQTFEAYMEKYPSDADALAQLGEMAMNAEEYADAVTYYAKAAEAADTKTAQSIRRNYIAACEYAGQYEHALDAAKSYLDDYPNDESMKKEYEFIKTRISTDQDQTDTSAESSEEND